MKVAVVDASVVAAALFGEEHADKARNFLTGDFEFHAPDFIAIEIANVIWKRQSRGEIDATESLELLRDVEQLPLIKTPAVDLAQSALELAMRLNRTVYDSLYLALAVRQKAVLVTVDRKLVNAFSHSPLKKHVAWLGLYP